MSALLSRLPVRISLVAGIVVLAILVGRGAFREPQQLCVQSVPGTVVTVRGTAMTATHVPLVFSVVTGRSSLAIDTVDGQHAEGSLIVHDARSPSVSLAQGSLGETQIDFCNFLSDGDTYATEQDGVITVYVLGAKNITPTGFTLTRAMRDGVRAPARVEVSPNGVYAAYITWDEEVGAMVLGVAEVSGKNNVVLATVAPEQGEIAFDEFFWSGSRSIVYAEVTTLADGPDENGNMHERLLFSIDAVTHARETMHSDRVK